MRAQCSLYAAAAAGTVAKVWCSCSAKQQQGGLAVGDGVVVIICDLSPGKRAPDLIRTV